MSEPYWMARDAPWWAKMRRAQTHIDALSALLDALGLPLPPVEFLPTGVPFTSRIVLTTPVPDDAALIVGDAVHNMRSALDAVGYELARRNISDLDWDDKCDKATGLPVVATPKDLEDWFSHKVRARIYDDDARSAIASVQPFYSFDTNLPEGLDLHGIFESSMLGQLTRLSNIDKHRRLAVVAFGMHLASWTAESRDGGSRHLKVPTPTDAADTLGYLVDPKQVGTEDVNVEVALRLSDLRFRTEAIQVLENWHRTVTCRVIPRLFTDDFR